jgi:hypothetical protein
MEALRKNERQGETQFIIKIDGFLNSPLPPWIPMNYFYMYFLNLTLFMTKLTILMLLYLYFINKFIISLLYTFNDHTFLQIHIN